MSDLAAVIEQLPATGPAGAERAARVLDQLAMELSEAAAALRAGTASDQPGPPGARDPDGSAIAV